MKIKHIPLFTFSQECEKMLLGPPLADRGRYEAAKARFLETCRTMSKDDIEEARAALEAFRDEQQGGFGIDIFSARALNL
jgi:hypothetical protein